MKLGFNTVRTPSWWSVLRTLISQMLGRSRQVIQSYRTDRLSYVDLCQDLRLLIRKEDPLLIDVGANAGQTIRIFKRLFERPVIHAFEPNRALVETQLGPAFGKDKNLVLNAAGLGAKESVLTLYEFEKDEMNSFLPIECVERNPFAHEAVVASSEAPVWTFDQYVREHGLGRIDLLKIDTQGYDLQVLIGAEAQLAAGNVAFVMLEINFIPLYQGQPTFGALDAFLRKHGYALVDLYEKVWVDNRIAWCNGLYQGPVARA